MGRSAPPDLILTNARVLTMDRRQPSAEVVAVRDGRIVWTGAHYDIGPLKSSAAKVIDCGGGTLLPGFHDAHMHLLSYAASRLEVDCRPSSVSSINDVKRVIRERASRTPNGEWIRAWGYDETSLRDQRHPTRRDLDEATSAHPVRLDHRSGHASVLNSLALERVGISSSFSEPDGATIERELDSGEPSGLLLEMEGYLDGKTSTSAPHEIRESVEVASQNLLALGVTSIQDATPHNSAARWDFMDSLRELSAAMPRITLMPGASHVPDFAERGLSFGSGDLWLRVGHAKILSALSSGTLTPNKADMKRIIRKCAEAGFPVAIHAVEAEAVLSAAEAVSDVSAHSQAPHRIEHASECPNDVLGAIARSEATVATQPGFVYQNGDRYLREAEPRMQPYLYRIRAFADAGVNVAFGSDAPVGDPNTMRGIYSAACRRTESGNALGPDERISLMDALRYYTAAAARATGLQDAVGKITPSMAADMVLFDEDISRTPMDDLADLRPAMTFLGGALVFES